MVYVVGPSGQHSTHTHTLITPPMLFNKHMITTQHTQHNNNLRIQVYRKFMYTSSVPQGMQIFQEAMTVLVVASPGLHPAWILFCPVPSPA